MASTTPPPDAAKLLAHWVIQKPTDTVLEPSFGGCALLSAAASVFNSLGNCRPSRQLYGFDVDPAAFAHLASIGITNEHGHFRKQDFLLSKAGELRVDAVLANPPFVSYHRLDEAQRRRAESVRQMYMPSLPKLASLWAHFVLHSTSYVRDGGRMAFLLPNAIGNADYAKALLEHLSHHFSCVELVHVSERLFIQEGADERVSLLLLSGFSRKFTTETTPIIERNVENIGGLCSTRADISLPDPERIAAEALDSATISSCVALGTVASVRIGEVVGDIRAFVKPLAEWRKLRVPVHYLEPLLTRSVQVKGLYTDGSVRPQAAFPYLLLPPTARQPEAIRDYLSRYSTTDIEENKTFSKRKYWYLCSYDSGADAFIGSLSHDYPRIVGNTFKVSCSNAFYKISALQESELAIWLPIISLTTPMRLSAEILGRVRGSGGIKLEPSDVRRLLTPAKLPCLGADAVQSHRQRLERLVASGEVEAAGEFADSLVYLQPALIDPGTMSRLRLMRIGLTSRRLNRAYKGS